MELLQGGVPGGGHLRHRPRNRVLLFLRAGFRGARYSGPENTSYIHITAAYVFMRGLGYWFVARDMLRNIDLVKLGVIYKAIYVGLAVYYLATGELLHEVFAWFAVADLVFLVLFTAFLVKALPAKGGNYARG